MERKTLTPNADFLELLNNVILEQHDSKVAKAMARKMHNYNRALASIDPAKEGSREAANCIMFKYRYGLHSVKLTDKAFEFMNDALLRGYRKVTKGIQKPYSLQKAG